MAVTIADEKEIIDEKPLIEVIIENTIEYGNHVNESRAIPDYRDGLKPVARKILWAAYQNGFKATGPYYKSARLIGDVIGKFSPHGDLATYHALVNMVNLPVSTMAKQGNFGAVNDANVAAQRYTEVKLSKYGEKCFFNPYLEKIVPMMPNYDGREKEPLFLPALMPNIFINGTSGIGFGTSCDIPPIKIETLLPFIDQVINGEKLSSKKLAKNLRFNWKYGSHCISSTEEIINWLENGSQSLWFEPDYELNSNKRTIIFNEVSPNFDWDKIVEKLHGEETRGKNKYKKRYDFISSLEDECFFNKKLNKEIVKFIVRFKTTVDPEEFSDKVKLVVKEFTSYIKTATNVTFRTPEKIKFVPTNIPNLIVMWTNYRIAIEKAIISQIIAEIERNIDIKDLMLLAIANRKEIAAAWAVTKPYEYVQEKLNITEEQSRTIMGWSLITLANLSKEKILSDRHELIFKKKIEQKIFNNPTSKVLGDLSEGTKLIT